jgi:hypothetical protein
MWLCAPEPVAPEELLDGEVGAGPDLSPSGRGRFAPGASEEYRVTANQKIFLVWLAAVALFAAILT